LIVAVNVSIEPSAAIERGIPSAVTDACLLPEIAAVTMRPTWTSSAATTQCGVVDSDSRWQWQTMSRGISQTMLLSSLRYGLTPRMDIRWGVPGPLIQSRDDSSALQGSQISRLVYLIVSKISEGGCRRWRSTMESKVPTANPSKGFGMGYIDHQFTFIASRDVKRTHIDFNTERT
jgi:hypothetical protein